MAEHPIYPDPIELLRDFYIAWFSVPVVVAMTKQDDETSKRHESFLRLRLLGGSDRTRVSGRFRVNVEAWAPTNPDAHDLAQEAVAVARLLQGDGPVHKVTVPQLPGDLPDPDSMTPRYVSQVELFVRGTALTGS